MAQKLSLSSAWLKPTAFVLLALPLIWLLWQWGLLILQMEHALGANPIETTHHFLGNSAIRILLGALAITPLAKLTGIKTIMRLRRMVGLYAFFYACLHLLAFFGMDLLFSLSALWTEIIKRNYIAVGMAALLLMLPLAVTSTNAMVRRLGGRNWQRLHRLVYAVGILAVIHHIMMVKGHQFMPWLHAAILTMLLGYRAANYLVKTQRSKIHRT